MRIEATITAPSGIRELAEHGQRLEEIGFDTILVPEAGHDPFLPVMTLAGCTRRVTLGTGVAIAFPRSPFVTAQLAWDLQRFSGGRFQLGLGTQVKAHNVRRYSTPWPSPAGPRLREYVQCLRAIFAHFSAGAKPDFVGKHYQFTLSNPFFNPGAIPGVEGVPIYLAAVNPYTCRLAGELADGLRMHPLNSASYIREVVRPAVAEGARRSGRDLSAIDLVINLFAITGADAAELATARDLIRRHISFYAATQAYFPVMEHHGWTELGNELVRLSREKRWADMPALVSDEMVDAFSISGRFEELPERLRERFSGLVTTVNLVFGPPYAELQERQRRMFESLGPIMPELKAVQ